MIRGLTVCVLFLIILIHLSANLGWITLNTAPPPWDQAGHTLISYNFSDALIGRNNTPFLQISPYYPPLVHILVAFFMISLGKHPDVGSWIVTAFFLISIVLMYLYTISILQSRRVAILATAIYSFLPPIYASSRWFLLEIPLITFLLATCYGLLRSNHLSKREWVVLTAIFFALALLTKWTAIVYIFPVFIFSLSRKTPLSSVLLFAALTLAIVFSWYVTNAQSVLHESGMTLQAERADPQKLVSIENTMFYLNILANFQLTIVGFVLAILSSAFVIITRKKKTLPLVFSVIFTLLFFTLIPNKNIRYTLPAIPLLVIVIAYFLDRFVQRFRSVGWAATIGFILLLITYFGSLSFGIPFDPRKVNYQRAVDLPLIGWIDYINLGKDTAGYLAPKYDASVWPQENIIAAIAKEIDPKKPNVLLLIDKQSLNLGNIKLAQEESSITYIRFESPYTIATFQSEKDIDSYLSFFDMVLVADKSLGPEMAMRQAQTLHQLKDRLEKRKNETRILSSFSLPDGDSVLLYKLYF